MLMKKNGEITMVDLYKYEKQLYSENYTFIGGVDEVGRGPLVDQLSLLVVFYPRIFI